MLLNPNFTHIKSFGRGDQNYLVNSNIKLYHELAGKLDYDYFFIQFHKNTSFIDFPIDTLVPADILDNIKRGKIYLKLEGVYEAYNGIAEHIYKDIIIKHSIPAEQVILVGWNSALYLDIPQVAEKYKLPKIQFIFFSFWEAYIREAHGRLRQRKFPTLTKKSYSKKFICLNRRWRLQRSMLLVGLKQRGLLDGSFTSFVNEHHGGTWPQHLEMLQSKYGDNALLGQYLRELDPEFEKKLPMLLDDPKKIESESPQMFFTPSLDIYYANTYFSVVTEAGYERVQSEDNEEGLYVTEKIFKPVALGHPFVVLGHDHSLDLMRLLGYRTFSPHIDESYDTIRDPNQRLIAVLDVIEQLCNLQGAELEQWQKSLQPICEYNYNVFTTKTKFIYQEEDLKCLQFT